MLRIGFAIRSKDGGSMVRPPTLQLELRGTFELLECAVDHASWRHFSARYGTDGQLLRECAPPKGHLALVHVSWDATAEKIGSNITWCAKLYGESSQASVLAAIDDRRKRCC